MEEEMTEVKHRGKKEMAWKIVWSFLSIYLEKTKTLTQKDTRTPVFIAGLFTIAKTWKQSKCPSTDEWLKKMRECGLYMGFSGGSDGKESASSAGDPGSVAGLGRSSGEGNGNPLQYSCLENSMDRDA